MPICGTWTQTLWGPVRDRCSISGLHAHLNVGGFPCVDAEPTEMIEVYVKNNTVLRCSEISRSKDCAVSAHILGWPKSLGFHKMLWKNPNKLFDQPNIFVIISVKEKRMSIKVFGATERKWERHVECSDVGDGRGAMFSLCYRRTHNKAKQKRTLWGPVMTCVTPQFWSPAVHSKEKLEFSNFGSVQSLSHVQLFATPWTAAHQASLTS